MKKLLTILTLVLCIIDASQDVSAQFDKIEDLTVPKRIGYVNDFSGVFSQETRQALEEKLKGYEQNTGRLFLVVSFPALSCIFEEERCSFAFYEKWQIKKVRKSHHSIMLFLSGGNRRGERSFIGFSHDNDQRLLVRAGHDEFMTSIVDKLIAEGKIAEANVAYINFVIKALSAPIN